MNTLSKMRGALVLLLLGGAWLSNLAWAEVPDRVGRIAYLSGEVQFYSEAARGWVPAELNAPVSSRNSLFTGPDGRAEVRFGSAAATLDANTQLDIPLLDDTRFQARLSRGSASFRVALIESDESYEITALPGRYQFLQAGRYRIDLEAAASSVTVFSGLANMILPSQALLVGAGKSLSINGSSYQWGAARLNALDDFATQRDDTLRASQAIRYVSPQMTGYEELDANGRWENDADYGTVWYPTTYVSSGWVPYRDGHWAYVAPWGWTWIDAAPWGFAPSHYGRWIKIGSSWAWAPGTYVKRPSYAPALVAFIGGVPGASIPLAARPELSWYPLAPWENYRPPYRHNSQHLSNINNFRIKEPPSSAMRNVENQSISVNQLHGRTELPHAAFVGSRAPGRTALPAFSPSSVRGQAAQPSVPGALPFVSSSSSSGTGRSEFGEKRSRQEPWSEPAVRGPRNPPSPVEEVGSGSRRPFNPLESAPKPLPNAMPNTAQPPAGNFRSESFGRAWQTPPALVSPQKSEPAAAFPRENRGPQPAVQPPPIQRIAPEIPAATFRRQESGPRGGAPTAVEESRPESPRNRFGASQFGTHPAPPNPSQPEIGAPRMRVEPPVARPEPRIDLPNRSRNNAPEPQREIKREPEKEHAGGFERGRLGESKGRDQGPR